MVRVAMVGPHTHFALKAYPHFHNSAVNALVHGKKRWWLSPPEDAFFTLKHVKTWVDEDLPSVRTRADEGHRRLLECDQVGGEVIFVPDQWGHAVINLKDSIAVAFEFHE